MKRMTQWLAAATLAAATSVVFAQDIKIAHIYDKTGPLEAYAKQSHTGLMMGLEYLTGGKMELLGRRIVVIPSGIVGRLRK
jgi:branched-chain amino acid transport system substrate-binding protein